ncbi:hypothetical protein K432DRAFT_358252 [Lepidopterella palustris CBS 459.81]|uniref:Thioesterase domain-containing protein n=1 Tax=Lepidopterella palustris CBS 459.81 TaxID=1314670 RepID=A0A8E2E5J0_9PEZI|nr:hypothetical protein K432DRAFT_358252 [Lepidopterella palustris CBS 459.81]
MGKNPAAVDLSHSPFERASAFFKIASHEDYDGHDAILAHTMTLTSATFQPTASHPYHATTSFTMTVPRQLCNLSGNLHGGAVALIFDICTSVTISVAASPGFWDSGHVSRTLNCTYLRPAKLGMKVVIESEVVHLGRRMGVVRGAIRGAEGEEGEGKVFYVCEHGKAALDGERL